MPHGFDMYRVFISGPGDLEADRDICRAAISSTNETEAMPHKILLVSLGLMHDELIVGFRAAVAQNVRESSYYIQVFQDDWGPKNLFRKMFLLATECREDEALPMREVVVCLKSAPNEIDPEVLAFRKELEDRQDVRVIRYDKVEQLRPQLLEVLKGWVAAIRAQSATAGTAG